MNQMSQLSESIHIWGGEDMDLILLFYNQQFEVCKSRIFY